MAEVTPERVSDRLAVLLSEMLPAEPRATFYDRARQTIDLLALVVGAEERRERGDVTGTRAA